MEEFVELQGTLNKVLFKSPETGFSVFVLKINSRETVIVRGPFPSFQVGEHITFKGQWVSHPKFGRQFEAKEAISKLPSSVSGIRKYLGSGMIKGIGPTYAKKLVERFGAQALEVIDKDPDRLFEVDGIGAKRVALIKEAWQEQKEISKVMVFLQDKGITTDFATKIFKAYGQQSIEKIQENPYRLSEDIWGVGFKSADKVALKIGFDIRSLARVKAAILHALLDATNNGHLYLEIQDLKSVVLKLIEIEEDDDSKRLLNKSLRALYEEDKVKLLFHDDKHYLALPQFYYSEKGVANRALYLQERGLIDRGLDFNKIYDQLRSEDSFGVQLNEEQQKGILTCLQSKITIITGGPGTGKTTLIKKLLEVLDSSNIRARLAAPTGRAAKRIFEGTGRNAETLHRLLEFSPATMGFARNEENAIQTDFLIIDEASMIDVFLMNSILKALPLYAHLVLIGDVDQLPSVGAGNVLNDFIESGKVSVVRLTQIFRQAQDSMIIVNAHKINKGEFPTSSSETGKKDFYFIKEDEPANIFGRLRSIYSNLFVKYGISAKDSVVLCPMNRGVVGTQRLNQELQEILNPGGDESAQIMRFGQAYKVGDRVMQIRNNYDKFVFNGDMGEIVAVDKVNQKMRIMFGDRVLDYDFVELNEIVLSYAISIHKSQGSEFKAVIIPIFMQHFIMLQRNLIYTAITRAKKLCFFIGQPRAIAMGIKNDKGVERNTFLQQFLTSDLEAK